MNYEVEDKGEHGRLHDLLTADDYAWLMETHGVSRDELAHRAEMTGSTLREAMEAFREDD